VQGITILLSCCKSAVGYGKSDQYYVRIETSFIHAVHGLTDEKLVDKSHCYLRECEKL